ncbi:MAG: aspartate kinase, partial [Bacteroidales bacterium]
MKVLKFGGSSVANAQSLASVLSVVAINAKKHRIVIVVSAISGITDLLIKAGREAEKQDICFRETVQNIESRFLAFTRSILPVTIQSAALSMVKQSINEIEDVCSSIYTLKEMSDRTCDKLVSYGEIITSRVISEKMTVEEIGHQWIDSRTIIRTDNHFGKANVNLPVTNKSVRSEFQSDKYKVFLLPGFIASDPEGNTTTLGRGGSDYTAAIIGAALNASCVEIWTDVSGMMTADPRQVKNARPIPEISYLEAMELSHFGAKVLYPPVIRPTMLKKIPLLIKNTFAPDEQGTLITDKEEASDNIRGISSISGIVLLRLEGPGMIGIPGFSKRLFAALAAEGISVVLITQASSEFSICVAISDADETKAIRVVSESFRTELTDGSLLPVKAEGELAIIALVGNSMVNLPGISGRMFGVLGRNGV